MMLERLAWLLLAVGMLALSLLLTTFLQAPAPHTLRVAQEFQIWSREYMVPVLKWAWLAIVPGTVLYVAVAVSKWNARMKQQLDRK